ncbi:segregation/condensation protein A [archaeon]|jgi:segregation and condensation protein A|nr:segregation/condensation protein A [archaeon]MBT3577332.1 segregation/condensation protein A [archaeon]MBT6820424.1 segregation/condensation protein A [archaeon]MBT6956770.1 segregation/condensation protein A [archaeon]MBT7025238.1 segregation/condensation protein A [archaeon]
MREKEDVDRINQSQFFDLITSEELSWQALIYDLIKTEQLDPWDIDIGILADKYVEAISQLEEADFFISSKVLLACSLLLRLKSDILVNSYIQSLDDALYGRKEERKYEIERLEIDENELPILVPRTPMARHRKVTLKELMGALNKAIDTENRRIKREIKGRQAEKSILVVLPKGTHVPLRTRVKNIFARVKVHVDHPDNDHMKYSHLAPSREEKLASFVPVLHLSNNGKLFLRQPVHFDEIHMTLNLHPEELQEIEGELDLLNDGSDDVDSVEQ